MRTSKKHQDVEPGTQVDRLERRVRQLEKQLKRQEDREWRTLVIPRPLAYQVMQSGGLDVTV